MTVYLPQPDPMTAADVFDIADFLYVEGMRDELANRPHTYMYETAEHLRAKAERMSQ